MNNGGYTYRNLKEQLDVLLPSLGQALINNDQLSKLRTLAARLTPVSEGGFECRLGPDQPQVDLHQCIYPTDCELALLRDRISAIGSTADTDIRSTWTHLHDFLTELSEPSSPLHSRIPEIWLEYDNQDSHPYPLPFVFIGLPQRAAPSAETYDRLAVPALDRLLGSHWHVCKDKLYRCFARCSDGAFISHIGVILSGNSRTLRVNVKRLRPDMLISYLQRIGWQGQADELRALVERLFAFFDRITVCLDIGQKVYPQIGFECITPKQSPSVGSWDVFLGYLVEKGLCEPRKREALLSWPGRTDPMNTEAPWPDRLIAESLLKPRNCFTLFNRRLSHIKVVWKPQYPLEAKAYLWYRHQWLSGKSEK